jgi:hypothetical protein
MKKNEIVYTCIVIMSFLIAVLLGYFSEKEIYNLQLGVKSTILPNENTAFLQLFTKIYSTNLIIGTVVIYFLSYVTGGLLAILILFINGFILGRLLMEFMLTKAIGIEVKALSIIHMPIEIYAFLLLSIYSHKGFYLIVNMIQKNEVSVKYLPKFKILLFPVFLLFIAAILTPLTKL